MADAAARDAVGVALAGRYRSVGARVVVVVVVVVAARARAQVGAVVIRRRRGGEGLAVCGMAERLPGTVALAGLRAATSLDPRVARSGRAHRALSLTRAVYAG